MTRKLFKNRDSMVVVRIKDSWGKRGLLFVAVPGLLIAVASLAVEHGF